MNHLHYTTQAPLISHRRAVRQLCGDSSDRHLAKTDEGRARAHASLRVHMPRFDAPVWRVGMMRVPRQTWNPKAKVLETGSPKGNP